MYSLFKPGIYIRGISPEAYMPLFTHIACLPPGTVVYNWLVHYSEYEQPKLLRAQTYPDETFLVWQEIIPRILDIPLCKDPLGNKNRHTEEQSFIYIKRITARQKNFIRQRALSCKEYMYIFFGWAVYYFLGVLSSVWLQLRYQAFLKGQGSGDLKKRKGGEKEKGWLVYQSLHSLPRFASVLGH